jgi:dynactin 1
MADYKLGQTIETNDGRQGIIRYIGEIAAADGQFIGAELPTPTGKNDGSIKGIRYFTCTPFHGLFVRPSGISRIISQPAPPKPAGKQPRTSLRPMSLAQPSKAQPPKSHQKTPSLASRPSIAPAAASSSSAAATRRLSTAATRPVLKPLSAPSKTKDSAVDTLETKNKHLERQHADYNERLKELDTVKGQRDHFKGIIDKLQSKCQAYHTECSDLKSEMKQAQAEIDRLQKTEQEAESVLELATLDREMAEERAEQAEAEVETLRQKLEEQALELDIIRDEAEMLTEDLSMDDQQAASYRRLQKERDRLKDALIRLKELTEESDADLKARIRELQGDLAETDQLREETSTLQLQISDYENTIEDLRQQVDAANSWEDIIEDLSDQNEQFKNQIADKDIAIKDLENLKELNDELEVHHIEQANELRAELDAKDVELAEQHRKLLQQDAAIADQENLITKFRDLVLDLQSKMNDVESSKTMSEEQAKDVTGRFHEVMELNRRLRDANLASAAKTITSELQKLQAEEAGEELSIVKQFLPDPLELHMNDSLRAYFRIKRIEFKAKLCSDILKNTNIDIAPEKDQERFKNILSCCSIIHEVTQMCLKSRQFGSTVYSATVPQFATIGRAYEELFPVEQTLEGCLQSVKQGDIRYGELAESLRRSSQILHMSAADFHDDSNSRPDLELIFRAFSIRNSLALVNTCFGTVRNCIKSSNAADISEEQEYILAQFSAPIDEALEGIHAAQKLAQTLDDLALTHQMYPVFPSGVEEFIQQDEAAHVIAQAVQKFASEVIGTIAKLLQENSDAGIFTDYAYIEELQQIRLPSQELSWVSTIIAKLKSWNEHASVLENTAEIDTPGAPWTQKASDIRNQKLRSIEYEGQLKELTIEHQTTLLKVREREGTIEIKELEIEHLKAKNREAVSKAEDTFELQHLLEQARVERDDLHTKLKELDFELRLAKRLSEQNQAHALDLSAREVSANAVTKTPQPANLPQDFDLILKALTNENQWLRRREYDELFGQNLAEMFVKVRRAQAAEVRRKRIEQHTKARELLDLSLDLALAEEDSPSVPTYQEISPTPEPHKLSPDIQTPLLNRRGRRSPSPLLLTPLNTASPMSNFSWGTPEAESTPRHVFEDLEDLSYIDLSPIAEEFASEMEEALGGFSELGENTLLNIVERATASA